MLCRLLCRADSLLWSRSEVFVRVEGQRPLNEVVAGRTRARVRQDSSCSISYYMTFVLHWALTDRPLVSHACRRCRAREGKRGRGRAAVTSLSTWFRFHGTKCNVCTCCQCRSFHLLGYASFFAPISVSMNEELCDMYQTWSFTSLYKLL